MLVIHLHRMCTSLMWTSTVEHGMLYGIICVKCKSTVYVVETEREMRETTTEHIQDVCMQRDKPFKFHFREGEHTQNDLSFVHYENTPIQIYRKFHLKKMKIFR